MTEMEISRQVAEKTAELNRVLKEAQESGLFIVVKAKRIPGYLEHHPRFLVETSTYRRLP